MDQAAPSPQPTVNAEENIMADGTVEYVYKNAFGDELDRMPNGYYRSPQFIGTLTSLSSKYLRIPRVGAPLKYSIWFANQTQPSLFEAINKGNCSDVPGISKAILDSFEVAVAKPTQAHYIMSSTPLFRFPFLTYNVAKRLQDKSFRKSSTETNEVAVQAMNECHPDEAKVASHA
ncbi:uncharacterized protein FFB14_05444 [Fusarium fujikuroi]|nr:uncharacterized protein FFB14_05444 [Fusarium fujikuroi]